MNATQIVLFIFGLLVFVILALVVNSITFQRRRPKQPSELDYKINQAVDLGQHTEARRLKEEKINRLLDGP